MFSKKIISSITVASTILILTGCSAQGLNNIEPNPSTNNTNVSNNNLSQLNDLKFSKVSEQKTSEYNNLIAQNVVNDSAKASANQSSGTTSTALALATPAVAPVPMVATAGDAKMAVGYVGGGGAYPMSYFPQPGMFEEYVVIDFEEAKTAGFSGTYLNALNTIVKPVIQKMGTDVRMVNSYGTSDDNGVNKSEQVNNSQDKPIPAMSYYSPYQWQFSFVSPSKKEAYNIFISSSETLVLRQKWGVKELNPNDIKIDSSDAIKLIKKAIGDKNFTSPDNQPSYFPPEAEVLYELPNNATWYLYLEKDKGSLVWNINFNINANIIAYAQDSGGGSVSSSTRPAVSTIAVGEPNQSTPSTMPVYPEYWYNGGYARVDAATGKILSLVRPTKYRNVNTGMVTPPCCKGEVIPLSSPDQKPVETK